MRRGVGSALTISCKTRFILFTSIILCNMATFFVRGIGRIGDQMHPRIDATARKNPNGGAEL
jgi:hypothetical protein